MDKETLLHVSEIFRSIQGESTWAGLTCTFVRLAGCNLRCAWCDTSYGWEGGTPMPLDDVLFTVEQLPGRLVEITGGEPLLQETCPVFAARLLNSGYTVLCETNGSLPIDRLPAGVVRIMDVKCPASGMVDRTDWSNMGRLTRQDEVKFVLADRDDYLWAKDVVNKYDLAARTQAVLMAPVFGRLAADALAKWLLEDRLNVRLQIQLHKVIWGPERRGV